MSEFLTHLDIAARSPLALAAYVVVILAWIARTWLAVRPQRRAKEILALYKSDSERTRALGALFGTEPPKGLAVEEILAWTALQISQRTRVLVGVCYIATLLAIILVVALALSSASDQDAKRKPIIVDETVDRPNLK